MNAAFIAAVIELANKVMDQIPNYDQRQKKKLRKLEKDYLYEVSLEHRDDERVSRFYYELHNVLEGLLTQISE